MAFITKEELSTHLYTHQIDSITQGDDTIIERAINAATQEVASYLGQRYDCTKIFAAEGNSRSELVLENTKVIVVWNIIKLSNAELLYDVWKDRYDRVIDYLTKIAKGIIAPELPPLLNEGGQIQTKMRFGSNKKFNHGM